MNRDFFDDCNKEMIMNYKALHKLLNETKSDNVHHPKHYQTHIKGLETIDVIYAALGPELFGGYCRGNVLKYLLRADQKNGTEDLEKARVYLTWEIENRKRKESK